MLLNGIEIFFFFFFFLTQFLCQAICTQRTRRDLSNRRLNEHGIYIRHCQESNSQLVPSQAGVDTTMTFVVGCCLLLDVNSCLMFLSEDECC